MNHSNTDDMQPVPATQHVSHSVETPVDNSPTASAARLLVIGSENWSEPDFVAQAMLNWWVKAGRPPTQLLVDGRGSFGAMVTSVWNDHKFDAPTVNVPDPDTRNPERKLRRELTHPTPTHVLLFRRGEDPYVEQWVEYLRELAHTLALEGLLPFSATIIQIDEVQ